MFVEVDTLHLSPFTCKYNNTWNLFRQLDYALYGSVLASKIMERYRNSAFDFSLA